MTSALERVLRAFLEDSTADRYGYDLMKATKLPSGTLYPMLGRLESEELIIASWEPSPQDGSGRPPRRFYRLTGEGVRIARLELAQHSLDTSSATGRQPTVPHTAPGGAR